MITTRREVDVETGGVTLTSRSVKRITPETRTVSINPDVEIKPFSEATAMDTVQISAPVEKGDVMPVISSTQVVEDENKKETGKLSSRAKMMLYVYMAAAFILAMIVLVTGLAITNASKEVASLENTLSIRSGVLANQGGTIAYLGDEATIAQRAEELGMSASSSAKAIELVELSGATEYSERTNAFDKFCDFLSKIIGG